MTDHRVSDDLSRALRSIGRLFSELADLREHEVARLNRGTGGITAMIPEDEVRRIQQATDEEEARDIELLLLEQSDNRPQEGDPPQPEEES